MHSRGSQVLLVVARTPEPLPEETPLTPTQDYKPKPLMTKANFKKCITCMSWSPCPLLLALANLFRHSGDIHLNIGPLLILLNFVNCGNIDYVQHRDNVMKRQLQKELDPTNNVERDINKNTVHSCLQLKLFEQDVGLQVCKTTKYVPTYTIQYTLNRSRA